MRKPMRIKTTGIKFMYQIFHDGRFICHIHRAVDTNLNPTTNKWNGKYVWVHADRAGYPIPRRQLFNSLLEAYAWVCATEGITPLF